MPNIFVIPPIPNQPTEQQANILVEGAVTYAAALAETYAVNSLETLAIEASIGVTNIPDDQPGGFNVGTYAHPTTNMFGRQFVGAITFCQGQTSAFNSNDLNKQISLPEVVINTCLISVSNRREIVKTKMLGRDGYIRTFINNGDYDIEIELTVVASDDTLNFSGSYNGIYPYSLVQKLDTICKAPCMIRVDNDYLAMLGVTYVVINNMEIAQEEGSYSQQKIKISCESDNAQAYSSILGY